MGCSLTEITSLEGTQQIRRFFPTCGRKEDPISETLCTPVFRIPDDGQSLKVSISESLFLCLILINCPNWDFQVLWFRLDTNN
jgi:hypothetical protein